MKRTLRMLGWTLAGLYALQVLACFVFRLDDELEHIRSIPAPGGEVRVSLHRHHSAIDLVPGLGVLSMLTKVASPWPDAELCLTYGDWQHRCHIERPDADICDWESMFTRQREDGTLELVAAPDYISGSERVLFRVYTAAGFPIP